MFSKSTRHRSTTLNQRRIWEKKNPYPYLLQNICSFGALEDMLLNACLSYKASHYCCSLALKVRLLPLSWDINHVTVTIFLAFASFIGDISEGPAKAKLGHSHLVLLTVSCT